MKTKGSWDTLPKSDFLGDTLPNGDFGGDTLHNSDFFLLSC